MRSSRQFSFVNGPKSLVFVRMYESTTTGLVGPPYRTVRLWRFDSLCFWCYWCAQNLFVKRKKEFKTALKLSGQIYASVFFVLQKDIARAKSFTSKNQLTKQK